MIRQGPVSTDHLDGGHHVEVVAGGGQAKREVVPNLGHGFPDDFTERLRRAVGFILDA